MNVFPRLLLGCVAVAALVSHVLGCSDIKMFLDSCTVKEFGTSITREEALDIESEFLKTEGLVEIADRALEYFDFDVEVFDGKCEFPINKACSLLNCGCEEALEEGEVSRGRRLHQCFPIFGCHFRLAGASSVPFDGPREVEETMLALCFGSKCKGFLMSLDEIRTVKFQVCGTPSEEACLFLTEPKCEGEVLSKCCPPSYTPNFCFCRDCSSRIWRRTTTRYGEDGFRERRGDEETCVCR